ncbi:hypothetical protein V8E53_009867 [Lactarius tabidus]
MPRNRKKSSAPAHEPSEVPTTSPHWDSSISIPPLTSYPSIYLNGTVDPQDTSCTLTSIVCHWRYFHLSPEELRFRDLKINVDPPRWELSNEEERLRYYLDEELASVPHFGSPTPAPAFSVSSRVKPTSSGSESSYSGLSCPAPGTTVEEESATGTCSLCAARLDAAAEGDEEYEATPEGLGGETPTSSISRHRDTRYKKRKRISRRVRRLEKTVEGLSHGLILALTELQDLRGRTTTAGGRKSDNSGKVDALSIALSGLSTVDHHDSTPGTSAPDATLICPSEQPGPMTTRRSQHKSTKLGAAEQNDVDDSSIFISDDRSPISGLLKPILDFMACPEVHRFLKWAEAHPGLRSTQILDLLWVANNLFDVHGGIMIYCLQKSFLPMDAISGATGSSSWSEDPKLMQRLDETVAKAAWESYCLELSDVFSEQFVDWESETPFFQNLSREYDSLGPMITSSYIEDLSSLWTEVHPALLEVTRWLEPFIDYGPDCHRTTPLYDATIALGRHARELSNWKRGSDPAMFSNTCANNLMRLLCENRSGKLKDMQREMESIMNRAKKATLWRVTDSRDAQVQDTLARREIRVMSSYRPKLLRMGSAAAWIRSEVLDVLMKTGRGAEPEEGEAFWDGCDSSR